MPEGFVKYGHWAEADKVKIPIFSEKFVKVWKNRLFSGVGLLVGVTVTCSVALTFEFLAKLTDNIAALNSDLTKLCQSLDVENKDSTHVAMVTAVGHLLDSIDLFFAVFGKFKE